MSNEDFSDVVFLFTARRTGGTALAEAFKACGFHLFFDPMNPHLADLEEALGVTSDRWLSKHPKGIKYYSEFSALSQELIPRDLVKLNSEWIKKGTSDYETVRGYFLELINVGRNSLKPVCFKVEEVSIYEMLKVEFASAQFIGLIRDKESHFDSYSNQALAANNFSFFESDWLTYRKFNFSEGKRVTKSTRKTPPLEDLITSYEWVREKHDSLVSALCDFRIENIKGEFNICPKPDAEEYPLHVTAMDKFQKSRPESAFGLDTSKILENFYALVIERDAFPHSLAWKATKVFSKVSNRFMR